MVSRRNHSREFKLAICQDILSEHKTKAQVCREHGLSPGMLDRWIDQYRVRGREAFPNSKKGSALSEADRVKELEALVGRLTLENEFLKSAVQKGEELREKRRK